MIHNGLRIVLAFSVASATAPAAIADPATPVSEPPIALAAATLPAATTKHYKFVNPLPFPVWIKIYKDGVVGYPQTHKVPAPPAPFAPVPYPGISMQLRVKPQGGSWSPKRTVNWKPGAAITLRGLLGM